MLSIIMNQLVSQFERRTTSPEMVKRAARILEWAVERPQMGNSVLGMQACRLQETVMHAASHSRHYRKLFVEAGVAPNRIRQVSDLERLPFTTSKQLCEWRQMLCVPENNVAAVFTTSGTTGEPKRLCFTLGDLQVLSNWGALSLRFRYPGAMVVLIAMPITHGLWTGSATAQRVVERAGGLPLPIGSSDPQETITWMNRFQPDFVISSPSYMAAITRHARKMNLRRPIKRILLSGELLPDDLRADLTDYWQAEVHDSYGTTELGGGQSLSFPGCTGFHLNDLHVVTEIVDPETGAAANEGEMVFTTLMREAMPLIRYRSGDRARWVKCACGLPFRSIEILGRTDDMIVAGDMNLYGNIMADAIGKVDGANGRIEILVQRENQCDQMTVRVEGNGVQDDHVRRVLYEAYPELAESVNNGVMALLLESNVRLNSQHKALKIRDSRRSGKSHNVKAEPSRTANAAVA